ncbi:TetR/AcrR family transcriptional regulator [Arthrobacter agilis]|jgi:AcrR family transcriptional regulator|uniref:TetR/AcrR family transcriptional regulator n=1 Tax=Arthrobacter agilis TaxID=37921 RepID=UPI0027810F2A|nr:TetR family transcriptional regulator [Arthrobacter agilis]MDQ0737017.1 AcrR family transcriptional regulator [Arthrobacter agilis]
MSTPTAKSEATRELLVSTALRLFRDVGYEKTTMRAIASAANVSTGSAYYYFASKDDLVHELYRSLQEEHRARVLPLLREGQNLGELLRLVLNSGIDVMAPYHDFGSNFISIAIKPSATTSPFGSESAVARARAITLFRQAVTLSRPQPPLAIRDDLPELLWYAYMAVTLFWVYDSSPDQVRTRRLIHQAAPLISKLVILSRLPVVRKIVEDIVQLIRGTRG